MEQENSVNVFEFFFILKKEGSDLKTEKGQEINRWIKKTPLNPYI